MKNLEKKLFATDFPSFVRVCHRICVGGDELDDDPYLNLLYEWAEDVAEQKRKRGVINLPPAVSKTFVMAVCLPAWILAHNPSATILIVEHSKALAKEVTRKILKIANSVIFKSTFPTRIAKNHSGAGDFGTTDGGIVFAASLNSSITGFRADYIIVDDLLSIKQAGNEEHIEKVNTVFSTEIESRIRDKKSCILIVMHRLNKGDLSAFAQTKGDYDTLVIPMVAERDEILPCRYGDWHRKKGEQIRAGLYSDKELKSLKDNPLYNYLYQQGTGENEAEIVLESRNFKFFHGSVDRSKPFIYSIDPNQKRTVNGSRMAIQVWQIHGPDFHLIDIFSESGDYQDLTEGFKTLARKYPPGLIIIEDTANGSALISHLRRRVKCKVVGVAPRLSKFVRFAPHRIMILRGRIVLPALADWVPDWIDEIVSYPYGQNDDHVDAFSMFMDHVDVARSQTLPVRRGAIWSSVGSNGVTRNQVRSFGQPQGFVGVATGRNPNGLPNMSNRLLPVPSDAQSKGVVFGVSDDVAKKWPRG